MNPEELRYAETHEWVHVKDGIATIGISPFAAEQLNDLVYMDLPEVGGKVASGEEFGEVESVKAVSPVYSPVNGEIVEVNSELPNNLEQFSEDAYGAWMIKVRIDNEDSLGSLLDYEAYQKQCADG